MNRQAQEHYQRNIALAEVGETGQEDLLTSSVLVIGAGGLGSAALLYLAAAGIGTLGIMDGDCTERSNLNRQILHRDHDLGRRKVDSAAEALQALNPMITLIPIPHRLSAQNSCEWLAGKTRWDLVLDCSDNFPTRFLIADSCHQYGLPLLSASVQGFTGQLFLQDTLENGPCYRCMIPGLPPEGAIPSPAQTGVLGAVAGTLGTMQASESIKYLLKIGKPLSAELISYDALRGRYRRLARPRDPECPLCGMTSSPYSPSQQETRRWTS